MSKNKFLKVLGIGVLACVGAVTMVGCSSIEVSQDQVDGLMESIEILKENSKEIKETNLYLYNQNKELKKQNEILEEMLESSNKNNPIITHEEAWNLYLHGLNSIKLNINGLADNIVVDDGIYTNCIYNSSTYGQVLISATNDIYGLQFFEDNDLMLYQDAAGVTNKYQSQADLTDEEIDAFMFKNPMIIMESVTVSERYPEMVTKENIVSVKRQDDGNISLIFKGNGINSVIEKYKDEYENFDHYIEIELNADGNIIAEKISSIGIKGNGLWDLIHSENVSIKYNAISENDIKAVIEKAIEHEVTV